MSKLHYSKQEVEEKRKEIFRNALEHPLTKGMASECFKYTVKTGNECAFLVYCDPYRNNLIQHSSVASGDSCSVDFYKIKHEDQRGRFIPGNLVLQAHTHPFLKKDKDKGSFFRKHPNYHISPEDLFILLDAFLYNDNDPELNADFSPLFPINPLGIAISCNPIDPIMQTYQLTSFPSIPHPDNNTVVRSYCLNHYAKNLLQHADFNCLEFSPENKEYFGLENLLRKISKNTILLNHNKQ